MHGQHTVYKCNNWMCCCILISSCVDGEENYRDENVDADSEDNASGDASGARQVSGGRKSPYFPPSHVELRERSKTFDMSELISQLAKPRRQCSMETDTTTTPPCNADVCMETRDNSDGATPSDLSKTLQAHLGYMHAKRNPSISANHTNKKEVTMRDVHDAGPVFRRRVSGWDDCDLAMMVSRTSSLMRKKKSKADHRPQLEPPQEHDDAQQQQHQQPVTEQIRINMFDLHVDDNVNVVTQLLTNQVWQQQNNMILS